MSPVETVQHALSLARSRLAIAPDFPLFRSIVRQLDYISRVLSGQERDKSRMWDITLGRYAAKEFETSDPELADALMDAQHIATQIARGLKPCPPAP